QITRTFLIIVAKQMWVDDVLKSIYLQRYHFVCVHDLKAGRRGFAIHNDNLCSTLDRWKPHEVRIRQLQRLAVCQVKNHGLAFIGRGVPDFVYVVFLPHSSASGRSYVQSRFGSEGSIQSSRIVAPRKQLIFGVTEYVVPRTTIAEEPIVPIGSVVAFIIAL